MDFEGISQQIHELELEKQRQEKKLKEADTRNSRTREELQHEKNISEARQTEINALRESVGRLDENLRSCRSMLEAEKEHTKHFKVALDLAEKRKEEVEAQTQQERDRFTSYMADLQRRLRDLEAEYVIARSISVSGLSLAPSLAKYGYGRDIDASVNGENEEHQGEQPKDQPCKGCKVAKAEKKQVSARLSEVEEERDKFKASLERYEKILQDRTADFQTLSRYADSLEQVNQAGRNEVAKLQSILCERCQAKSQATEEGEEMCED